MASQNLPGFAVLRASGYEPPARSILAVTGLGSLLTAPLGAHTTNLAAISGRDLHRARTRMPTWTSAGSRGLFYGAIYLVFAAFGASLVAMFAALPGEVVEASPDWLCSVRSSERLAVLSPTRRTRLPPS